MTLSLTQITFPKIAAIIQECQPIVSADIFNALFGGPSNAATLADRVWTRFQETLEAMHQSGWIAKTDAGYCLAGPAYRPRCQDLRDVAEALTDIDRSLESLLELLGDK